MTAISFGTSNDTWRQLIGNGLEYVVPQFQREYSWTTDEWDDLWQDMQATTTDGAPAHYMGYLVLRSHDNKRFEVIDGQQRLTTLSLLALAVLKALQELVDGGTDPDANRQRSAQLRAIYIGYLDPVTLVSRPKLSLGRRSNDFYQRRIVPLLKLPTRNISASEQQLGLAFDWLYRKVRDTYGSAKDGSLLARFLDRLSDQLFFTVIKVADELNAFTVFETLNARGVRLSPTDLLKNYLFSVVHREGAHEPEIKALEERWDKMVDQLGGENLSGFLRAHWNSRRRFVREAELFKTIRSATVDKAAVFALVAAMEEDVEVYVVLSEPFSPFWDETRRRFIKELRVFNIRQPWPLLLTSHRKLAPNEFTEVLKACSIISFRYNVIGGLTTSDQERTYSAVAERLASGDLARAADVVRALGPVYITDRVFESAFAEKSLKTTQARNKRIARYILFRLEARLTGRDFDEDSPHYSLEHILPENPGDGWPQFSDAQHEESVYRLGNMALLEVGANREIGNGSFASKKASYAASAFKTTQSLAADNDGWTDDRVAERQRWMAKQATAIWRIGQLS